MDGRVVEWDAEITEDIPDERIGWRSVGDADVPNEGRVWFVPAPDGASTEVHVLLVYDVPGGQLGKAVAKIVRAELVVIDDVGLLPVGADAAEGLYRVVEAAYERRFWGAGTISLTLRHLWISDVVDRVPVCVEDLDQNGTCDDTDANGSPDIFDAPGNIGGGKETDAALSLTIPLDRIMIKHGAEYRPPSVDTGVTPGTTG